MKIKFNGQVKDLKETLNLRDFVEKLCTNSNPVIAEINGEIIKSNNWSETIIKEGDTIELVSFVGGGST